jgi:hypothetical protein
MVPRPAWWCAVVLLLASTASADTFLVLPDGSGDFPAIQDAIDAAVSGDAIELGDGTFVGARNRNLDFLGKNLSLRSQSGDPASCVIDCQGQTRALNIITGETAALVEGITIRNGFGPRVGGPPSSPGWGGGIQIRNATATLRNCVVTECTADDGPGGALAGGVYALNARLTLEDCTIADNYFAQRGTGAGLFAWSNSDVTATRCRFTGNDAPGPSSGGSGGGIRVQDSRLTLIDCEVVGNTANTGAGISTGQLCLVDFRNCLIAGNLAMDGGPQGTSMAGGIQFGYDTDGSVTSCTIVGNRAFDHGAGISVANDCEITIDNTILWGNCSGTGTGESAWVLNDGTVQFTCSDVDPSTVQGGTVTYANSLAVDPQFCTAEPCTDAPTLDGSYTLDAGSPLLQAPGCALIGRSPAACGATSVPAGGTAALRVRGAPNPFRGAVLLHYAIPRAGAVEIALFDPAGRLVARFDEGIREAGAHTLAWDGRTRDGLPVRPGAYFARVRSGGLAAGEWVVRME